MSLAADERVEQFERGYQAALREAAEQVKALPRVDADQWAGYAGSWVVAADVLAVLEKMRRD